LGKREQAEFFVEESAEHGLEGCNYLLAVDMEMDPQPGYAMASWERGYGDFHLRPDLATLRGVPWLAGPAVVLCDVGWEAGTPAAGIAVESSKGEAWPGQQEINFRYSDALTTADNHVVYKNGAKEIAHLNGCSITFMAKPDHTWIGNSCHIHGSLWRDGENAFAGGSEVFEQWLAGWIACAKELALFLAPNINSYKRYAAGSWAPTTLAWGNDNGTCAFRVVGHGDSRRVATRSPGGVDKPSHPVGARSAAERRGLAEWPEGGAH